MCIRLLGNFCCLHITLVTRMLSVVYKVYKTLGRFVLSTRSIGLLIVFSRLQVTRMFCYLLSALVTRMFSIVYKVHETLGRFPLSTADIRNSLSAFYNMRLIAFCRLEMLLGAWIFSFVSVIRLFDVSYCLYKIH